MRLFLATSAQPRHKATVASVGWSPSPHPVALGSHSASPHSVSHSISSSLSNSTISTSALYSCSDDGTILAWTSDGESSATPVVTFAGPSPVAISSSAAAAASSSMPPNPPGSVVSSSVSNNSAAPAAYVTCMHFYPRSFSTNSQPAVAVSSSQSVSSAAAVASGLKQDFFAVGFSDGTYRFVTPLHPQSAHRVEGAKAAHAGATTAIKWNHDGSALATGGEDGFVKIWSRNGQLRMVLVSGTSSNVNQTTSSTSTSTNATSSVVSSVYTIAWSRDNDTVALGRGKDIMLKPLQASQKGIQWKAHDGCVLALDWSPVNQKIVSGGEDGRYKVWDPYGRCLYSVSTPLTLLANAPIPVPMAITSASWSPDGALFAVGGFNTMILCDAAGWCHSRESTISAGSFSSAASASPSVSQSPSGIASSNTVGVQSTGSLYSIAWAPDGATLAAASSSGHVVFAKIVHRTLEYKDFVLTQASATAVQVCHRHHQSVPPASNEYGGYDENVNSNPAAAPNSVISTASSKGASAKQTAALAGNNGPAIEEELVFKDPVLRMSAGFDHIAIMTTSQIFLYDLTSLEAAENPLSWKGSSNAKGGKKEIGMNPWTSPHVVDLNPAVLPPSMIVCGPRGILCVDANTPGSGVPGASGTPSSNSTLSGVTCVSWNGKVIPLVAAKPAPIVQQQQQQQNQQQGGQGTGLAQYSWNSQQIVLGETLVACLDRSDPKCIRFYDAPLPFVSSTSSSVGGSSVQQHPIVPPSVFPGSCVTVRHHMDVQDLALDRTGQFVAFIDRNRDLYIATTCTLPVSASCSTLLLGASSSVSIGTTFASSIPQPVKLATMVDSMRWHEDYPMIAALADGQVVVFSLPTVVFDDRDLLQHIKIARPATEMGRLAVVQSFSASSMLKRTVFSSSNVSLSPYASSFLASANGLIQIRRTDGTLFSVWMPAVSFASVLHACFVQYVSNKKGAGFDWQSAVRLCRFFREPCLWATLAGLAVHYGELNSAEVAYASLGIADRVQYILHVKDIPTPEGRLAEMAVFRRAADEAEHVLLQAGLVYRAIKTHIRLFHWDRALEIAVSKRQHVETVLAHRSRYLESLAKLQQMHLMRQRQAGVSPAAEEQQFDEEGNPIPSSQKPVVVVKETLPRFLQVSQTTAFDWERVEQLVDEEKEKESSRPGAKPY
eukprot:ANDGO_00753.mRNA.1 Protein HIR1